MFKINSLRTQLNLTIIFVFLLSFIGSIVINVDNSKLFFTQQLELISVNTAQKLAHQLQPLLDNDDHLNVKTLVDNTFEFTDFKEITISDTSERIIYQRIKTATDQAPRWFVSLFALQVTKHSETIQSEWSSNNLVEVIADNDHAANQLWMNTLQIAYFTLLTFLIALLFGYLLLRQIYAPLKAISQQAKSVQKGHYHEVKKLPGAIELKEVVTSMNLMVKSIKGTFKELNLAAEATHKEAYIDAQTNIPNRRAFNDQLDAYLSKSSDFKGFIALVRINELAQFNQLQGYQAGDHLIEQVIQEIKESASMIDGFYICRVSGSELSFFVENQSTESIEPLCDLLVSRFKKIESNLHKETHRNIISLGVIECQQDNKVSGVLSTLDELTLAATELAVGYQIQYLVAGHVHSSQPLKNQKIILEDILALPKSNIQLKSQKVLPITQRSCFDYEIFSTFFYERKEINATELFSIANKHQLSAELDVAIIKNVLFSLAHFVITNEVVAISLSHLSFIEKSSVLKIISLLKESKKSKYFVVQINERSVVNNIEYAKGIFKLFEEIGCKTCINHFGSSIESLQYLIEIEPNFVKIAPIFTRHIDRKSDNLQVVSAFVHMAHGLNIPVIAHCVETNEELETLSSLRLDAALGYVIDKPRAN